MNKSILKTLLALSVPAVTALPLQAASISLAADADISAKSLERFPQWSQPVPEGFSDPLKSSRKSTVRTSSGDGGENPALAVWASDMRYELGDTALFYARFVTKEHNDGDVFSAPGGSGVGGWVVTAEVMGSDGSRQASLSYSDDGKNGDEQAGDGVYTASYQLPQDLQPSIGTARSFGLEISAMNEAGESRSANAGFLYSHPAGELTGNFTDSLVDGNLQFGVEVEVESAGRFHLSGVVAGSNGKPLATAQTSVELSAGTHWVELPVYGLILREKGAAGRFVLSSVTLASTGSMPNALGEVMTNAHRTGVYLPTRFTDKAFKKASR